MATTGLQAIIRATLSSHHVTSDQLLALLNTDASFRECKLTKPRLLQLLRMMTRRGEVEQTPPTSTDPHWRVRLPAVRYGSRPSDAPGSTLWDLYRSGDCEVVIGKMTEAEARTCVAALNALDRKVRGIKAG